jgi:O-antigen/teichoic acid export membrane protein
MKDSVADSILAEAPKNTPRTRPWGFDFAALARWTPWAAKSSLAILDQGLISGPNFLIGIVLARWLSPSQYGAYALAFEIFLLLSMFHMGLVLEPLAVFGPSNYPDRLREYLGVLLRIQSVLTLGVVIVLGTSIWLVHALVRGGDLTGALGGMTIAAPFVLLLWLARGAFYVEMAPQYAAKGAAIYCSVFLTSLFLVHRFNLISPFVAFVLMGVGALASSLFLFIRLKPILSSRAGCPTWSKVGEQHWQYGKWVLAGLGVSLIFGDIYYPLVSSFSGLAVTGELKALLNFSLPVAQAFTALSGFFLPYAARVCEEDGPAALRGVVLKIGWLFGAVAAVYWTLLILFSQSAIRWLYGGHYSELAASVPWLAAASLPLNLAAVPTIALRAVRSSVSVFRVYCASSVIALLVGVPATWALGLRGALMSMFLSNLAALIVAALLLSRKLHNPSLAKA